MEGSDGYGRGERGDFGGVPVLRMAHRHIAIPSDSGIHYKVMRDVCLAFQKTWHPDLK
jgi:hypothetical protein